MNKREENINYNNFMSYIGYTMNYNNYGIHINTNIYNTPRWITPYYKAFKENLRGKNFDMYTSS